MFRRRGHLRPFGCCRPPLRSRRRSRPPSASGPTPTRTVPFDRRSLLRFVARSSKVHQIGPVHQLGPKTKSPARNYAPGFTFLSGRRDLNPSPRQQKPQAGRDLDTQPLEPPESFLPSHPTPTRQHPRRRTRSRQPDGNGGFREICEIRFATRITRTWAAWSRCVQRQPVRASRRSAERPPARNGQRARRPDQLVSVQ